MKQIPNKYMKVNTGATVFWYDARNTNNNLKVSSNE